VEYIWAFLVGGFLCFIGQILMDIFKLTAIHVMSLFVVLGSVLDGFGLYEKLIDFAGAGVTVPVTSLGYALQHGVMEEAEQTGLIGLGLGTFNLTSAGISSAILFGFLAALVFKPKG
jgi:stage V sporulation protein AE